MNRERAWVTCTSSDPENNNFAISVEKLTLKKSDNGEVFEHVKNTFEIEIDNEIFTKVMLTK